MHLTFTSNHSLYYRKTNIIRIISFSRYNSPTKLLFQQYSIFPFKKLMFQRLGLQLYKYEFGIIPIPLRSLLKKNSSVHNYNTRNSNKLRPAVARHAYSDKDFRLISVHVWNYICDNVNINVSFPSLKNCSFNYRNTYFRNRAYNLFLYSVLINMDPVNKLYYFDWMLLINTEYVVYRMCVEIYVD